VSAVGHRMLFGCMMSWSSGMESPSRGRGCRTHTHTDKHSCSYSILILHVHTWLLTMQCIMLEFQIVVLLRVLYWFQTLSMSAFMTFNYFVHPAINFRKPFCLYMSQISPSHVAYNVYNIYLRPKYKYKYSK